ncbi:MAG: conjugal transfer protein [Bacteroidia bacterium 44-10]|nr:MAG: conjugal transfer protein [Bacteroidia bacterium 44-10]
MKKFLAYFLYTLLLGAIVCACSDDLDINQVYTYDLVCMPVQKKIVQGETAEIRCQLVKEGNYEQAKFFIRYFQPDGKGELRMDDGTLFLPNDLYPLNRTTFRLYYTSLTTDQQVIDVYIEDNFGQVVQKNFSWQNDNGEEDNEEDEFSQELSDYDYMQFYRVQRPLLAMDSPCVE